MRWSGIPISFPVCCNPQNFPVCYDPHKGFSIVNEAEIDVLLEFSCFVYEPTNVGNLISGSSTFSKLSLYIWKF